MTVTDHQKEASRKKVVTPPQERVWRSAALGFFLLLLSISVIFGAWLEAGSHDLHVLMTREGFSTFFFVSAAAAVKVLARFHTWYVT